MKKACTCFSLLYHCCWRSAGNETAEEWKSMSTSLSTRSFQSDSFTQVRDFQLIVSAFRIATVSIAATDRSVQGDTRRLLVLQDCHKRLSTSKQISPHETCTSYFIIMAGKKLLTNTIIISLNPTHSSLTSLLHHEERKCKNLHNRQQISSSGYAKYTIKASLELEF